MLSLSLSLPLGVLLAAVCSDLAMATTITAGATKPSMVMLETDVCVQTYRPPDIRYPPPPLGSSPSNTTSTTTTTPWPTPPPSHLWSPYYMTYSTRPRYLALLNMQATHYPIFPQTPLWPDGSQADLISWSTTANLNDSSITTVFGYFRPLTVAVTGQNGTEVQEPVTAAWNYSSTGPLADTTNMWAILGWGLDDEGWEYRVDYEGGYYVEGGDAGNTTPCVNVASRRERGPSDRTYGEIVEGLVEAGLRMGDEAFVELVGGLKRMKTDGRRSGGAEVSCNEACVMNKGLVPGR